MSQRFGGGRSSGGDNGSQSGRTTWNGGDKGPAGGGSGESPKSYRFKTAHERLPEGIPQWFREGDRNRDGQIAMSEFSGQWNEKTLSEIHLRILGSRPGILGSQLGILRIRQQTNQLVELIRVM